MIRCAKTLIGWLALLAVGCWGDVVPNKADGGADTDSGSDTGPPEPEFYAGGGTGGGPIDGLVNVFFYDEATGERLVGAQVMLGDDPATALIETTDLYGLAVFDDAGLSGPVNLHVLAEGYSAESFIGLEASNATFAVRPSGYVPGYGELATISGTVSGYGAIPEPGEDEYRVAAVYYGLPIAASLSDREPELGRPFGGEIIDLATDGDEFSVEVPPEPGLLYAIGGIWRTFGTMTAADDEYEWTLLGMVTGLDPEPGESLADQEIGLEHVLYVTMKAVVQLLPAPYDVKGAALALDLGDDGAVWFPGRTISTQTLFTAPYLEGDLAGGGVLLVGTGDQDYDDGQQDDLVAVTPRARRYEHTLEEFVGYTEGPYVFDTLSSPAAQVDWDGTEFSCFPPSSDSLGAIALDSAENGAQLYRATVFGALPDSLGLPAFPAQWSWDGVPAGGIMVRAWATLLDADMLDVSFADYHQLVLDTAESAALVE
jgi:hypothetical protein